MLRIYARVPAALVAIAAAAFAYAGFRHEEATVVRSAVSGLLLAANEVARGNQR